MGQTENRAIAYPVGYCGGLVVTGVAQSQPLRNCCMRGFANPAQRGVLTWATRSPSAVHELQVLKAE